MCKFADTLTKRRALVSIKISKKKKTNERNRTSKNLKKYSQHELSAFYIMSIPSAKRKNFTFENVGY